MKRFDTYLGRIAAAAILLVTGGLLSSCNKSDDGPKLDKITVTVSEVNATATTAEFIGVVERESKAPADAIVGIEYSTAEDFSGAAEVTGLDKQFSEKVTGLLITTRYYYRTFVEKKGQRTYGDVESFTTNSVSASILTVDASSTTAVIVCEVDPEVAGSSTLAAGIELSADETFAAVQTIAAETVSKEGKYTVSLEGLVINTYYYIITLKFGAYRNRFKIKPAHNKIFTKCTIGHFCASIFKRFNLLITQQTYLSVPFSCMRISCNSKVFDQFCFLNIFLLCSSFFTDTYSHYPSHCFILQFPTFFYFQTLSDSVVQNDD